MSNEFKASNKLIQKIIKDFYKAQYVEANKNHVAVGNTDEVAIHIIDPHFWAKEGFIGNVVVSLSRGDMHEEEFLTLASTVLKSLETK